MSDRSRTDDPHRVAPTRTAADPAAPITSSTIDRRIRVALGLLFALALALRVWGVGFGLPHTYHPDEHQYVDTAVRMVGGDLDPERFNNPSGLKYAFTLIFAAWALAGHLVGAWDGVEGFQAAFAADPTAAYLIARTLVGLLGAATVFATFAMGRRLAGRRAGLVGAALLAVAFLHARDSHYAVSDVPAALLVTLVLLAALRVLDDPTALARRPLLVGAALTGLAAGTKYSALAVIGPLLLAHALAGTAAAQEDRPLAVSDLATALRGLLDPRRLAAVLAVPLVAAAAFLAVVPYSILNRPAFVQDIATLSGRGEQGFKGLMIDPAPGWIFYLESLAWGLGPPLLVAAVAGIGLALVSRRPSALVVASFPLLLWGYLGGELLMFARFMIPAVPALCALAGMAVERATSRPTSGERAAAGSTRGDRVAFGLAAALGALPLLSTIRHDHLLTRPDTRTLATRWIEANVPSGTPVLLQSAGPDLQPADDDPVPGAHVHYVVEKVGTLDLPDRTLDEWRADGWEILVTSSHAAERRLLDPGQDAAYRTYYAELEAELPLLAEFPPLAQGAAVPFVYAQIYGPATDLWRIERPGPTVRVYRLGGE